MGRYYQSAEIENPEAYSNAVEARIKANAFKGQRKRFMETYPNWQAILDYIEFRAKRSSFYESIYKSADEWGAPTAKQMTFVLRDFSESADRAAARKAERIAADSGSNFVGTVGERTEFTLTIRSTFSYESDFGTVHGYIMNDEAGNVAVFKGKKLMETIEEVQKVILGSSPLSSPAFVNHTFIKEVPFVKGDKVTGKATIKAHSERDGVKQTVVNRPKFVRA